MRINEYTSIDEFKSEYVGEWNPSEGHWFGLDFLYNGIEYRLHTGYMHKDEQDTFESNDYLFSVYRKSSDTSNNYVLLGMFKSMDDLLTSKVINDVSFEDVIMADETELLGQD